MIPKKQEWKEWSALEKATYIAQIFVPISLMVTVAFSYMGWSEARKVSEMQLEMFRVQNNPELTISEPSIVQAEHPILLLDIANTGNSTAIEICAYLVALGDARSFVSSCEEGRPFVGMNLTRSQNVKLPITSVEELESKLGFSPKSAGFIDIGTTKSCPTTEASIVIIGITFSDVTGGKYSRLRNILFCGQ